MMSGMLKLADKRSMKIASNPFFFSFLPYPDVGVVNFILKINT